jgi:hypothetical protein
VMLLVVVLVSVQLLNRLVIGIGADVHEWCTGL